MSGITEVPLNIKKIEKKSKKYWSLKIKRKYFIFKQKKAAFIIL